MTSMHVPDAGHLAGRRAQGQGATPANFSKALNRFTKEDPTFRVHRDEESAQTIISGMGELHLEIYIERMKREYNCEVIVGQAAGRVPRDDHAARASSTTRTRSRPAAPASTARWRATSSRCPPIADRDYEFVDDITGGSIPREFIPACDKGFRRRSRRGRSSASRSSASSCVINDGASHPVDSSEIAFRRRPSWASARPTPPPSRPSSSRSCGSRSQFPEEFQGAVMGQLNQRRGVILGQARAKAPVTVVAEVPLNDMFGYSTDLRSATQGKGEFTMEFATYRRARARAGRDDQEVQREARGRSAARSRPLPAGDVATGGLLAGRRPRSGRWPAQRRGRRRVPCARTVLRGRSPWPASTSKTCPSCCSSASKQPRRDAFSLSRRHRVEAGHLAAVRRPGARRSPMGLRALGLRTRSASPSSPARASSGSSPTSASSAPAAPPPPSTRRAPPRTAPTSSTTRAPCSSSPRTTTQVAKLRARARAAARSWRT